VTVSTARPALEARVVSTMVSTPHADTTPCDGNGAGVAMGKNTSTSHALEFRR
jgi:hypothetical protein